MTTTSGIAEAPSPPLRPPSRSPAPLRILLFTPSIPYPPIWGFGIRVHEFARLLARTHQVTLLTYAEPGDEERIAAVSRICRVCTVPRPSGTQAKKRRAQLTSVLSAQSYQRLSLYSRTMQRALDELTARERFDIIQIESSQLAGFDFRGRAPLVLDEHNIEYELLYRMYQTERAPARRLFNWLEYRKFRREEIQSWRAASGCVSTSGREEEIIRAFASTPTVVAANAVNVEYFRPSEESVEPDTLVMTGLMHYRPNIDGAIYFVRDVLPLILEVRPKAVFYIVGAGATSELKRLAGPNVVVTDTVPDVRPYLNRASAVVVPLRMGGGTRLKVLEALSMTKAVVSTSLGAEGINVRSGTHLILADRPREFADAVLTVMHDRALATGLAERGRELVMREYRWETVVVCLESFYHQLLSAGTVARPAIS